MRRSSLMRCKLLFIFCAFQILASGQTLGAQIDHQNLLKIIDETLAQSDDTMISQHPLGQQCLLLDFETLVYDVFVNLNRQNYLETNKFEIIKKSFEKAYPKDFNDLIEQRFDDFNAISWHPMAATYVEPFKALVFRSLISLDKFDQIKTDLESLKKGEFAAYGFKLFNSLANKDNLKKIVELWSLSRNAQKTTGNKQDKDCCLF